MNAARRVLTPRRLAGPRQRDHHDWLNQPWNVIDKACRLWRWRDGWSTVLNNTLGELLIIAGEQEARGGDRVIPARQAHAQAKQKWRHGVRSAENTRKYGGGVMARLQAIGFVHCTYGKVEVAKLETLDWQALKNRVENNAAKTPSRRRFTKRGIIGQIGREMAFSPPRNRCGPKRVDLPKLDGRAANGLSQQRGGGGRFGAKWPEHVPKEIPPDEIDRVDRELEEAERMRPTPPQQQPQEQKKSGHDAERRIPTVVPAPGGDGSADAAQPAWKNIWDLVEHYRANPAAAARVRAESAAEGSGMPAATPRPRLVAAQAPREVRSEPRPTQPPAKDYRQRDDATRADPTWLAFTLTRSKHLAPLMRSDLVRAGYNRGTWRAAVGGLLARAPGTVDNPAGFVHGIMRSLVSGTERDPRTKPGYFAHEGWGAPARQFACVD